MEFQRLFRLMLAGAVIAAGIVGAAVLVQEGEQQRKKAANDVLRLERWDPRQEARRKFKENQRKCQENQRLIAHAIELFELDENRTVQHIDEPLL